MVNDSGTPGRALGARILAHEGDGGRNDAVAAADGVCQKLSVEIGQFIGPEGFKLLLSRALSMAGAEFSFLARVRVGGSDGVWLIGLAENVGKREETELSDGTAAVVGSFIDLLGTFIGYDLTLRMIHRCWPEVPLQADAGNRGE